MASRSLCKMNIRRFARFWHSLELSVQRWNNFHCKKPDIKYLKKSVSPFIEIYFKRADKYQVLQRFHLSKYQACIQITKTKVTYKWRNNVWRDWFTLIFATLALCALYTAKMLRNSTDDDSINFNMIIIINFNVNAKHIYNEIILHLYECIHVLLCLNQNFRCFRGRYQCV